MGRVAGGIVLAGAALAATPALANNAANNAANDAAITAALGNEVLQLFVEAPAPETGHPVTRIVVNDRTVFEDRDSSKVELVNAWQVQGRWFALFQHAGDAKDCPARFRLLDLGNPAEGGGEKPAAEKAAAKGTAKPAAKPAPAPARAEPRMSALFGTCSDAVEVAAEIPFSVSMPAPQGGTKATWVYRDGQMARTR